MGDKGASMVDPQMRRGIGYCLGLVVAGVWMVAYAQAQTKPPDVEYVPTPHHVVAEMLRLVAVRPTDIVYDLGCGDGRVVIAAAKEYRARGVGVDIDPQRIQESRANARQAGVLERVTFLQQDLFETDMREATVVTLYLLPQLNRQLRPRLLRDLRPGTRVVSHDFDMGDWHPDRVVHVPGQTYEHSVYYWVIPANVDGMWRMDVPTPSGKRPSLLRMQQRYQEVRGTVSTQGEADLISNAQLTGAHLRFTISTGVSGEEMKMSFDGEVNGDTIQGSVDVQNGPMAGRYPWTAERDAGNSRNAPGRP